MKHPHLEIIKQWLEDTTQEIEVFTEDKGWVYRQNYHLCMDTTGLYKFRRKPKQDEYEYLRKAVKEGKFVEEQFHDGWVRIAFSHDDVIFDKPVHNYRIVDEYEYLRQALRDGKKIEFIDANGDLIVVDEILFHIGANNYRIHDQYRELKEAQEQGKRVIRLKDDGGFVECFFGRKFDFDYDEFTPEQYKIVEDDCFAFTTVLGDDINGLFGPVNIKLTKSGIYGTIKAEVVND
jgi:hypothetical protein